MSDKSTRRLIVIALVGAAMACAGLGHPQRAGHGVLPPAVHAASHH